jgi:hypothetical protein
LPREHHHSGICRLGAGHVLGFDSLDQLGPLALGLADALLAEFQAALRELLLLLRRVVLLTQVISSMACMNWSSLGSRSCSSNSSIRLSVRLSRALDREGFLDAC